MAGAFALCRVFIQLRVSVREITSPAPGTIEAEDNHNPFYCQQLVSFKLTSPKLTLKVLTPQPSQSTVTRPPMSNAPQTPMATRSISVVTFSPAILDSPAPRKSTSVLANNEVGHSVFFGEKDEQLEVPTVDEVISSLAMPNGNASNGRPSSDSGVSTPTVEHTLFDPDRSKGVSFLFVFFWLNNNPLIIPLVLYLGRLPLPPLHVHVGRSDALL